MFMYAETGVHVGGGESVGAIDLAIAREKYTDFPFIPSSGVKGAIRAWFDGHRNGNGNNTYKTGDIETIFGPENDGADHAGAAIFTDARILLFPVRSLKGVYAWITCPLVIERLNRDLKIADHDETISVPAPAADKVIVPSNSANLLDNNKVVLEEYTFEADKNDQPTLSTLIEFLERAFPQSNDYDYWRGKLNSNLVIMNDDDFRDFAKSSTEVQARIRINSETKTVETGGLFYQENLPSDTLMYSIAATHDSFKEGNDQDASDLFKKIRALNEQSIQLGGNESIGKGIFNLNFHRKNGKHEHKANKS
jgi:CRISPR-associated protein Cmr4